MIASLFDTTNIDNIILYPNILTGKKIYFLVCKEYIMQAKQYKNPLIACAIRGNIVCFCRTPRILLRATYLLYFNN